MKYKRIHNFMAKRSKITIVLITLVLIGIGYSYINSTLGINGATKITKANFDVHFENLRIENNTFDKKNDTVTLSSDNMEVNFDIVMENYLDTFQIIVDVVNAGTVDASLKSINVPDLSEYTNLNFRYNYYSGEREDDKLIKLGDVLRAGETDVIVISVSNINGYSEEDIDKQIDLSLKFTYGQANKETDNYRNKSLLSSIIKNVQDDNSLDFSKPSSSTNGNGLFVINSTKNDLNPIYYYRGQVDNNFVFIRENCYRILRTTNDGNIKLFYYGPGREVEGKYICSLGNDGNTYQFNSFDNDNAAAGYYYGSIGASTYEETHVNTNKSNLQEYKHYTIDGLTINIYNELIVYEKYCNDRSGLSSGTNESISNAYNRIINNTGLSLYCSQPNDYYYHKEDNDRNEYGNITADEAIYAGAGYTTDDSTTSNSFINVGRDYWTITPARFHNNKQTMFKVSENGMLKETEATSDIGYLPLITITKMVRYTSGKGKIDDAYYIYLKPYVGPIVG